MGDLWTPRIVHLLRTDPKDLDPFDHRQICDALERLRNLDQDHMKLRRAFDNLCRIVDIDTAITELYLGEETMTDELVVSAREDLRDYQDASASAKEG